MSLGIELEDAVLANDMDAQGFNLLNVASLNPVPIGLVSSTDPRLSDARFPLDGSVTDASVAPGANIDQSKLNLNGNIPASWLGTTDTTAAQGNLAEYLANKGQPNGYAGLDGGGKVPSAQLPTTAGAATVTSVGLSMPAEFSVSGSPITGSGVLDAVWASQSNLSWFGNKSGGSAAPQFYTSALPTALIPSLDASIVTTGVFGPALLPAAVGIGSSHAPGAVPDPGPSGGGALATDYLARDMTYKAAPSLGPSYQPTIANPVLANSTNVTGPQIITATATTDGAIFFYSTTSSSTGFAEFPPSGYVSLPATQTIWVYAAREGWTNSGIVSYTNPNP